jgi:cytoskeletal protein RodZ
VANAPHNGVMRNQHGQVMAFIAVALATVLMPLAAYVIDIATVSATASALQEATATAAIEAAQQLDAAEFRAGSEMTVDPTAARTAARAVLAAEVPSASVSAVTVSGAEVTVAASELIQLPVDFLPTRLVRLEARASARLAAGYDMPSSRLPLSMRTF